MRQPGLAFPRIELRARLPHRRLSRRSLASAGEVIYDILGQLAVAAPQAVEAGRIVSRRDRGLPQTFKIVVTCQPHGSIPASLWSSSYILFVE